MTEPERALHHDHPEMSRAVEDASWLPSGLLRRSGLFHEVSTVTGRLPGDDITCRA
ncbi:hypothetical protein ABT063_22325 [Streptomyces sp. NPDC002838]|uniref:hypothetical protein n=1 Tax=Streptomyces sp. NPDC002838 TaxID=3154436 RepID=UPI00332535F8